MMLATASTEPPDLHRQVYVFGDGAAPPDLAAPDVVGSKAYHLMRLAEAGLPVPPGFVLGTGFCQRYLADGHQLPSGFLDLLASNLGTLERLTGRGFGSSRRPLLVSARSGAATSMPGMMETVLNLGLSDTTVSGLLRMTGNPRLTWDSYRRLVQAYAEVVAGCPRAPFEQALQDCIAQTGVPGETELDVAALKALVTTYKQLCHDLAGRPFPQDPLEQLTAAIEAVFRSWQAPHARQYRELHGLDHLAGTSVTIQTMVFGNMGGTSGSGVAFTRDPATGADRLYVDFVLNGQGEDVVGGRRIAADGASLALLQPGTWRQLQEMRGKLERLFKDTQDFEFTIEDGRLYLLQTRPAKRTALAALRIAVALVHEGVIDEAEALRRLAGIDLTTVVETRAEPDMAAQALGHALAASPGIASGAIALDTAATERLAARDGGVILVREDTTTADLAGMVLADGILTALGSRTAHAAVVARQMNKVCLVGCRDLQIDLDGRRCQLGGRQLAEGTVITLDGNHGRVFAGPMPVITDRPEAELAEVAEWRGRLTG